MAFGLTTSRFLCVLGERAAAAPLIRGCHVWAAARGFTFVPGCAVPLWFEPSDSATDPGQSPTAAITAARCLVDTSPGHVESARATLERAEVAPTTTVLDVSVGVYNLLTWDAEGFLLQTDALGLRPAYLADVDGS